MDVFENQSLNGEAIGCNKELGNACARTVVPTYEQFYVRTVVEYTIFSIDLKTQSASTIFSKPFSNKIEQSST